MESQWRFSLRQLPEPHRLAHPHCLRLALVSRFLSQFWRACLLKGNGIQGDGTIIVDPYPFESIVETTVKMRKIPDINYGSHSLVYQALEAAEVEEVKWKFVPPAQENRSEILNAETVSL